MKKSSVFLALFVLLSLSLFLTSCATIATGTTQLVTINSNVDGAIVSLDGVNVGKTPFTGEIKKNGKVVTIEKEGYKTYTIALSSSLEGLFWGNIIIGGTLGSITDFATGAAYKYAPASYQVELMAKGMSINNFKQIYELKKYAMINMSNISIDLSKNNGTYLESLIYLTNMDKNEKSIEIIRKKLIESKGDQVHFGNVMVKLLVI